MSTDWFVWFNLNILYTVVIYVVDKSLALAIAALTDFSI